MALYEIKGRVEAISKVQTFQSGFKKRDFVIQEDSESKYPNFLQFTLKKDKIALADSLKPGDYVTVKFAVEGRKWDDPQKGTTRYFVDLAALAVNTEVAAASSAPSVPEAPAEAAFGAEEEMPF